MKLKYAAISLCIWRISLLMSCTNINDSIANIVILYILFSLRVIPLMRQCIIAPFISHYRPVCPPSPCLIMPPMHHKAQCRPVCPPSPCLIMPPMHISAHIAQCVLPHHAPLCHQCIIKPNVAHYRPLSASVSSLTMPHYATNAY